MWKENRWRPLGHCVRVRQADAITHRIFSPKSKIRRSAFEWWVVCWNRSVNSWDTSRKPIYHRTDVWDFKRAVRLATENSGSTAGGILDGFFSIIRRTRHRDKIFDNWWSVNAGCLVSSFTDNASCLVLLSWPMSFRYKSAQTTSLTDCINLPIVFGLSISVRRLLLNIELWRERPCTTIDLYDKVTSLW